MKGRITYKDGSGKEVLKEKVTESFAAIMVRVIGFKDIYSAWEEQWISTIDDFKIDDDDDDEKVNATQSEYLAIAPKVLCL